MALSLETPALLFSATSLILLAYTNRFLTIAQIIRSLKKNYQEVHNKSILLEIHNLNKRLSLIRLMQLMGVLCLFLSVFAMLMLLLDTLRGSQTADRASDLIKDSRHKNDIGRGVEAFDELVDTVDFPTFVKDLVKGVFDANMAVMKEQTENYIRLMKEASKSVAQFVKQVTDEDAYGELANSNDNFNLSFDEEGAQLKTKDGEPVDMEDNEVKAAVMDAKLKIAKEHRKILQQMIMMGITRMVVDKGTIKAGVAFDFKSKTDADFQDKAMNKNSSSGGSNFRAGGGLIGSIFGGPSGGTSNSRQSTSVSVSSAKSSMRDELSANLTGNVELQFSTDYFKLDKFVDLYKIESDTEIATNPNRSNPSGGKQQ